MNKPTVTVTPDDGGHENAISIAGVKKTAYEPNDKHGHYDDSDFLYHAIERIAELEAEREQLSKKADQYHERWVSSEDERHAVRRERADLERQVIELREQNSALSAHVERLSRVFLQGFESSEDHDLDAREDDAKAVLARQPQASLAQRDARMKAEAISDLIEEDTCIERISKVEYIELLDAERHRDKYRQQAEENNQ